MKVILFYLFLAHPFHLYLTNHFKHNLKNRRAGTMQAHTDTLNYPIREQCWALRIKKKTKKTQKPLAKREKYSDDKQLHVTTVLTAMGCYIWVHVFSITVKRHTYIIPPVMSFTPSSTLRTTWNSVWIYSLLWNLQRLLQ